MQIRDPINVTATGSEDKSRLRPAGVTFAAVLVFLSSLVSFVVRLVTLDLDMSSVLWVAIHVCGLVVATGLWRVKRWAYWSIVALIIVAIVLQLARLLVIGSALGPVFSVARLVVLALWLWYFALNGVRRAFVT